MEFSASPIPWVSTNAAIVSYSEFTKTGIPASKYVKVLSPHPIALVVVDFLEPPVGYQKESIRNHI